MNQHKTLMSSILKPPLGMRKHMETTHSPQSSLVHECKNLTTVEPRLSGPRLSGLLDYPDFSSGPNLVMNIY